MNFNFMDMLIGLVVFLIMILVTITILAIHGVLKTPNQNKTTTLDPIIRFERHVLKCPKCSGGPNEALCSEGFRLFQEVLASSKKSNGEDSE